MKYNPIMKIGNIFTGFQNPKYEIGKQYDFEYRLCHIKANSDYSEYYWVLPWGEIEYLGDSLLKACIKLDEIHQAEQEYDEEIEKENNLKNHGIETLPDNVYTLDDAPF